MDRSELDAAREHERSKYLRLAADRNDYGATSHGAPLLDLVCSLQPEHVVDFGCGRNQFCAALRARGVRATGIDFAFAEADVAAAMHDVPLEADSADVVTSFDALEHLLPDDVPLVLAEMARVGRPGGRFFFTIAFLPSVNTVDGEGLHPTTKPMEWWIERISAVGEVLQTGGDHTGGVVGGRFSKRSI
jgi:SAM-dependent methyltransferase